MTKQITPETRAKRMARLEQLIKACSCEWNPDEFFMWIPAQPDHDADLILSWALKELKRLEKLEQDHADYVAGHGYADALVLEFKQRIEELEAQNVVIKRMLSHARAYGVCAECGDQSGAWIDGRDREGNAEVVQCQTCVQCKTLGIREVTDSEC